jgi:xanthine/CO dehydrogenase XdhC/CoxF family maturation factor
VLVATMSERDLDAIEAAARFAPAYLGLISSRTRLADLRQTLLARGVAFDRPAPVGARRGSVEYKQEMARVLVGRALRKAVERAGGR